MRISIIALMLACATLGTIAPAGDAEQPAEKKEKPKEKPFKCDAWCVFSDLSREKPYVAPDPESDHSRPNATNLGGFGKRGRWAHVVLDLQNTTDPKDKFNYEGYAEIHLDHRKPNNFQDLSYKTEYRQSFQIAPQSEKQYHFSVFCPEESWQSAIALEVKTNRGTYTRQFELSDLDASNRQLIVVVSDQPGAYKYLGPQRKNLDEVSMDDKRPVEREVASVTPSELPARWHDLAVASLLIIDGPPAGGLSDEQWDAVKTYAQSGGKVLIMAGKDPARITPAVAELCGITVRGSATLPFIEWPTRFPHKGEKSIPIIEVAAPGAGVVKRNSKTQMVEHCAKSYGAGIVYFLPYSLGDKMFEDWPERITLPRGFISSEKMLFAFEEPPENTDSTTPYNPYTRRGPRGGYYQNTYQEEVSALSKFRNGLDLSFSQDTPVIVHPPSTVAWFIAVYLICAVPVNWLLFTILRRREAAWLVAPLLGIGFTVGAYQIGFSGQTGVVTVNEVSVLEMGPGQSNAVGRTFMGVYTPRRDDYQIQFPPENLGGGQLYDTEAAPSHLINTNKFDQRDAYFPSMRIRDDGKNLKIDEVLIQTRDTVRFEVQHRAWVNGGIGLNFVNGSGDEQSPTPRIKVTNNTGRPLYNAVFIKGNQYLELQSGSNVLFENGQQIDTGSVYTGWQVMNDSFFTRFASRFSSDSTRHHIYDRASHVSQYLKTHMKQYSSGVFMAWADGASLPVKVGPTGGETKPPNLEGITLMVVPAVVSNRGWRQNKLDLRTPYVLYTGQYNPELPESGGWKLIPKSNAERVTFNAPRNAKQQRSLYLKLQFDPAYSQYIYENKSAELSFYIRNNTRGGRPFSGELFVQIRDHGAEKAADRFKPLKVDNDKDSYLLQIQAGSASQMTPITFRFEDSENFTPPGSIVLNLQPVSDDDQGAVDNLTLERVELKIVDKKN